MQKLDELYDGDSIVVDMGEDSRIARTSNVKTIVVTPEDYFREVKDGRYKYIINNSTTLEYIVNEPITITGSAEYINADLLEELTCRG